MDGEKKEAERTVAVVVVVVVEALKQKPAVVRWRQSGASGKNNLIGFKNY